MAIIHGLPLRSDAPDSERKLINALAHLSDDWHVVPNVSWQSRRWGREGDGEADVVLVHPSYGVVVVEVKGGGIEIRDGVWFTRNRMGKESSIKDPYQQAVDSKFALKKFIDSKYRSLDYRIEHAVAFPDLHDVGSLGPAATPAITWNASDIYEIAAAVSRTVAHWRMSARLDSEAIRQIVSSLAPTVSIQRRMIDSAKDAEIQLVQLTNEQTEAFMRLRTSRSALVLGGAGTGKTLLAMERAKKLASDGFETLLVCYNELLGNYWEHTFSDVDRLTACTFHSLCIKESIKAGHHLSSLSEAWWENEAANQLLASAAQTGLRFDAVVVDEGQDFSASWLEALRCLQDTTKDAPFYLFGDDFQKLWDRNNAWAPGERWDLEYQLTVNCRNTLQIARRVAKLRGGVVSGREPKGPEPKWVESADPAKRYRDVARTVQHLLDQGFPPEKVVVLCAKPSLADRLKEISLESCSFGPWGSRGVQVETIARFKGMEAEAAVVVLDEEPDELRTLALAYVGLSRARSTLWVVGDPKLRARLGWRESPT